MRRLCAVLVTTSALVAAPAATPAVSADTSLIRVGRSVGAVALGMTSADVVAAYGRPTRVQHFVWPGGEAARLAHYTRHGGAFRVGYAGGRAVWIETASRWYRTQGGVGTGSSLADALALPGFEPDACTGGAGRQSRGALTLFTPTDAGTAVRTVLIVKLGYVDC